MLHGGIVGFLQIRGVADDSCRRVGCLVSKIPDLTDLRHVRRLLVSNVAVKVADKRTCAIVKDGFEFGRSKAWAVDQHRLPRSEAGSPVPAILCHERALRRARSPYRTAYVVCGFMARSAIDSHAAFIGGNGDHDALAVKSCRDFQNRPILCARRQNVCFRETVHNHLLNIKVSPPPISVPMNVNAEAMPAR